MFCFFFPWCSYSQEFLLCRNPFVHLSLLLDSEFLVDRDCVLCALVPSVSNSVPGVADVRKKCVEIINKCRVHVSSKYSKSSIIKTQDLSISG